MDNTCFIAEQNGQNLTFATTTSFVAYMLICLLCSTKQTTPQLVIGYGWKFVLLLLSWRF